MMKTSGSSETNQRKNRLFAKYGHECAMDNELDELPKIVPGNSLWNRFRRYMIRLRMVSEININSYRYFRSQGAIANEHSRHLKSYFYMVHPFSDVRHHWTNFMCFIFLVQFIAIPLDIAYFRSPDKTVFTETWWKWFRMTADSLCLLDVLSNFITGYYNIDIREATLDCKKVAAHYLKTFFIADFISSLPTHLDVFIDIDVQSDLYMILQLTSLLKLLRLYTFLKYCRYMVDCFDMQYTRSKLIILTIMSILFFHWITCSVVFIKVCLNVSFKKAIMKVEKGQPNSIIATGRTYLYTLYMSTTMICNSGGLYKPKQLLSVIFVLITWFLSKLIFILVLGTFMQITQVATSATNKYTEMVHQLRKYMRHRHLPAFMQRRLLAYYEFRFQKTYFRESEILSTISGQLRQEIVMHSCRKLVENVAFFKNLPLTLLIRIVSSLHSEVFLINDVIVRANTSGNSMFFIASGTVAVYTTSGKEICHLEDGAHFGEIALVMKDELRVASVVAVEVCELYRLDRQEFVRAILPYPDLLDNIQRIAADRMEMTTMIDEHNRREMATMRLY